MASSVPSGRDGSCFNFTRVCGVLDVGGDSGHQWAEVVVHKLGDPLGGLLPFSCMCGS